MPILFSLPVQFVVVWRMKKKKKLLYTPKWLFYWVLLLSRNVVQWPVQNTKFDIVYHLTLLPLFSIHYTKITSFTLFQIIDANYQHWVSCQLKCILPDILYLLDSEEKSIGDNYTEISSQSIWLEHGSLWENEF